MTLGAQIRRKARMRRLVERRRRGEVPIPFEGRSLRLVGVVDAHGWHDPRSMSIDATIGGVPVATTINETFRKPDDKKYRNAEMPPVRVMLGVEPIAHGRISAYQGWTGTDVTPGDPPQIIVGDWGGFDLYEKLEREWDGREVVLEITEVEETPDGV